jgi:hypothetical protein
MKKLFLAGAIALFGVMNAQKFGLKAGLNIASISNSGVSSKTGFYGGVFVNAPISSQFSIQPELVYSQKGAKGAVYGVTVSENLDYLSVPVMFQYNATPELYLEAGPEFSFLMSGKGNALGQSVNLKDMMNSFDFGLGIGIGYYLKLVNLGFTARYVAGFMDTVKDNSGGNAEKNGVFQIGLAYKFTK